MNLNAKRTIGDLITSTDLGAHKMTDGLSQGIWEPKDPGEFQPAPTEPGTYWARTITLDFVGREMLGLPKKVKVVSGVANERGHKLLVETGLEKPHHCSLNCYRWGPPTINEIEKQRMSPLARALGA